MGAAIRGKGIAIQRHGFNPKSLTGIFHGERKRFTQESLLIQVGLSDAIGGMEEENNHRPLAFIFTDTPVTVMAVLCLVWFIRLLILAPIAFLLFGLICGLLGF
ncbi:MAG: hypothetical protein LBV28_04865 [Puniceicoccales bacterium]|nr:hypothetical protein [Puniceicoccales bacterium]